MFKNLVKISAILISGLVGGMLWQAYFLPLLAQNPRFAGFKFVKMLTEREVNVFPKEEIIIRENEGLTRAIDKIEKAIVGVKTQTRAGKILEGSGMILTSDGLLVTLNELVPRGSVFSFWVDGELTHFAILKRDEEQNLVLVKLERGNLTTTSFFDPEEIRKGERVFAVWTKFIEGRPEKMISEGIIKFKGKDFLLTDIVEEPGLKGSPLFNLESSLLGINTIDLEGRVKTIPISQVREFAGL